MHNQVVLYDPLSVHRIVPSAPSVSRAAECVEVAVVSVSLTPRREITMCCVPPYLRLPDPLGVQRKLAFLGVLQWLGSAGRSPVQAAGLRVTEAPKKRKGREEGARALAGRPRYP